MHTSLIRLQKENYKTPNLHPTKPVRDKWYMNHANPVTVIKSFQDSKCCCSIQSTPCVLHFSPVLSDTAYLPFSIFKCYFDIFLIQYLIWKQPLLAQGWVSSTDKCWNILWDSNLKKLFKDIFLMQLKYHF